MNLHTTMRKVPRSSSPLCTNETRQMLVHNWHHRYNAIKREKFPEAVANYQINGKNRYKIFDRKSCHLSTIYHLPSSWKKPNWENGLRNIFLHQSFKWRGSGLKIIIQNHYFYLTTATRVRFPTMKSGFEFYHFKFFQSGILEWYRNGKVIPACSTVIICLNTVLMVDPSLRKTW